MAKTINTDPKFYDIQSLLNSGVQPFEDLDEDAQQALAKGLQPSRRTMPVPIVISSDDLLIDGHQRLKAMLGNGRVRISANDVRVLEQANAGNALEWAVRLNVQRRHMTAAEKAVVARRLQKERKWSQAKVAELFGVTQSAVSQWLKDDIDKPTSVIGTDGVEQPVVAKHPARPRIKAHPWDLHHGELFAAVEKLTARLGDNDAWPSKPPLTDVEFDAAKVRLLDLATLLDEMLTALGVDLDEQPTLAPWTE